MSKLKNNIYTTDVYPVQDWLFWPGWNTDHETIEGRDAHSDSKCTQSANGVYIREGPAWSAETKSLQYWGLEKATLPPKKIPTKRVCLNSNWQTAQLTPPAHNNHMGRTHGLLTTSLVCLMKPAATTSPQLQRYWAPFSV